MSHKIGHFPTSGWHKLLEIKKRELSLNLFKVWEYATANKSFSLGYNLY